MNLSGVLVEQVDPVAFEAAYCAFVAEEGEAVDQALLDEKLRRIGTGSIEIPVDQSVRVILEDGTWRVCELAAQE